MTVAKSARTELERWRAERGEPRGWAALKPWTANDAGWRTYVLTPVQVEETDGDDPNVRIRRRTHTTRSDARTAEQGVAGQADAGPATEPGIAAGTQPDLLAADTGAGQLEQNARRTPRRSTKEHSDA